MRQYEFDIDMPDDEEEAYQGPDGYTEGDDNVLELEIRRDDNTERSRTLGNTTIAQILRCKRLAAAAAALLSRHIY